MITYRVLGVTLGMMKRFRNYTEVVVAQHHEGTRCYLTVHFNTLKKKNLTLERKDSN